MRSGPRSTTMLEQVVLTNDGRTIQVREDGDRHGLPVFLHHGSPGCRFLLPRHVEDARNRGIRLIGHDRPGYGGSTRRPGRRIGDEADDIVAIADALGIDRFAVYGYSGGGAPALACAARLPARVVAASSIAGVAPYPADGFDWFEGTGEANVEDFKLMLSDQAAWEAKSATEIAAAKTMTPEQFTGIFSTLLSEVDRKAFTDESVKFLMEQFREGYRTSIFGGIDDGLAVAKPWGFELSSIHVPTQIWHGQQDKFVPYSHGKWLASHVPNAEVHLEPNEGHVSLIVNGVPSVHEWLASKF
jgi:pimeloyl-ACP methyl ester carboxylesterase